MRMCADPSARRATQRTRPALMGGGGGRAELSGVLRQFEAASTICVPGQ